MIKAKMSPDIDGATEIALGRNVDGDGITCRPRNHNRQRVSVRVVLLKCFHGYRLVSDALFLVISQLTRL